MPAVGRPGRGRGTLVAIGFPLAALVVLALGLELHGVARSATIPTAVVLVVLTALAQRINLPVSARTSVSTAGAFIVAAGLAGGPLVGACAGAAMEALTTGDAWRKRSAYAGAGALQGFAVGLVGEKLASGTPGGSVATVAAALGAAFALNAAAVALVARDRGIALRPELLASRRAIALAWSLPAPLLVAFLFLFRRSPGLALALACGTLLALGVANRFRLGLERSLEDERSRARVDALTHAPNRYALTEALAVEQARIRRGGRPAGLCFLDLDRFKKINDTHGYAAGDRLLVDVYQRVRNDLRASDVVFRWGGEEFVVLAPHLEAHELSHFAERLRLLIAGRPFSVGGRLRTITVSVGAVLLEDARPPEAALETASRLVRKAKLTRNTAVVEAPPHTGPASRMAS
jgi:diguanylate cyclase (GGDEF)-like protein